MKKEILYTSKNFCSISGITMETLRHYIDLGLLVPARVRSNGYREFSMDNAVDVFYLRHERGLGASLNQFHPENEAESLVDQSVRYQENLIQLQKQKELLERQIDRNIYYQNLIQRAMHQIEQPMYLNTNQLFSLSFLEFSEANLKKETVLKTIDQWMQHPELLHMAFRIDPEQMQSTSPILNPRIGLGVRTDFAEQMSLPLGEAQTSCGSGKMIITVSRSESLTEIPRSALASLERCVKHPIQKELVGRLITRVQEEGKLWYYFSISADLG